MKELIPLQISRLDDKQSKKDSIH